MVFGKFFEHAVRAALVTNKKRKKKEGMSIVTYKEVATIVFCHFGNKRD
jgi:hypothetical protein